MWSQIVTASGQKGNINIQVFDGQSNTIGANWSQIVTGSARISSTKRPPQDIGKTAKGLVSKGENDNLTVPPPYG